MLPLIHAPTMKHFKINISLPRCGSITTDWNVSDGIHLWHRPRHVTKFLFQFTFVSFINSSNVVIVSSDYGTIFMVFDGKNHMVFERFIRVE